MIHLFRFTAGLCLALAAAVFPAASIAGPLLSFGGVSWDQDNAPNTGTVLADGVSRGGATFSGPGGISLTNPITGFVEGQSGFSASQGVLSVITGLAASGTRAVNLPQNPNINQNIIRRGLSVGWSSGTNGLTTPVLPNGVGNDFVLFESGGVGEPDAIMVRVRDAQTGQFSDWYYQMPDSQSAAGNSNPFRYLFDLSDFGIGADGEIDLIEIANMVSTDRIDGTGVSLGGSYNQFGAEGFVLPELGGAITASNPGPNPGPLASPDYDGRAYTNATYDPDPLYIAGLQNLRELTDAAQAEVPEPASLAVWGLVSLAGATYGWRKRRRANATA